MNFKKQLKVHAHIKQTNNKYNDIMFYRIELVKVLTQA